MRTRSPIGMLFTLGLVLVLLPAGSGPQSASVPGVIAGQTATLLADGRWLLLGGEDRRGVRAGASIHDPATQTATPLAESLQHARAGHTATVLPDGRVLIVGGVGAGKHVVGALEVFDPATESFETLGGTTLTPRAYHTATLLTDGRVLFAGRIGATGAPEATAELWGWQTESVEQVAAPLTTARQRHAALLLPDGRVLLWGGVDQHSATLATGEIFDAEQGSFVHVATVPALPGRADLPQLTASLPAAGAADVPVEGVLALRFSKPLDVRSLTEQTVTLTGPAGVEAVQIVAAEGGRLAFLTPEKELLPGTEYTISVSGVADGDRQRVAPTAISFTTELPGTQTQVGVGSGPYGAYSHDHGRSAEVARGQRAEQDAWEWQGERRNGKPYSRWQSLPPLQAPPGVTALAGQVLRLNGEPLAEVTLQVGAKTTQTDRTGRFLLAGSAAGQQVLVMNGSTANRRGKTYGIFAYGVPVRAQVTTVLPFTIWLPLIDTEHATAIPVPTTTEVVVRSPRIPGLELRVPANVVLQGASGPLTSISLTQIPVDRPPFPLPAGTEFFFTPQAHGARVLGLDGKQAAQGVRIIWPNVKKLPPGVRVPLWSYESAPGFHVAGEGTVSGDGRQIVPDPGVQMFRVTCVHFLGAGETFTGTVLEGKRLGDPVDIATGSFVLEKTDLVVQDVIPIVFTRTYRTGIASWRPLGIGATHPYAIYVTGDKITFQWAEVILANGARVRYDRTSPGTDMETAVLEHTQTPTGYYKSKLAWNTTRSAWDLTFRDGTIWRLTGTRYLGPVLDAIEDRNGNKLTVTRLNSLKITRLTTPNGRYVDLTLDAYDRITQLKDNIGRTVSYTYDGSGRLATVTDPAGGVTEYTYDTSHRMLTLKDPRNIVFLTNEYDTAGKVIRQTQADGTTYQFAYTLDGNGKIIQTDVTDPRGNVERVTFNASGYMLTDTRAHGTGIAQTTTYERQTGTNLPTAVIDALR